MSDADPLPRAVLDLDRELGLVHQYQLAEKTRSGVNRIVWALIFSGFLLNDGNVYISAVFWTIAATLFYVARHIRRLSRECRSNIEGLRSLESRPPFHARQFIGLSTYPSGAERLVGEVISVDGKRGVARIRSEPLRGVTRAWVGEREERLKIKRGNRVFFVYSEDDDRCFIVDKNTYQLQTP